MKNDKLNVLSYCEFGAVGDGVHDDYEAIKQTHEKANAEGLKVVGEKGKTYNLGVHDKPVVIKTDVDWTDCKFIVDDSKIAPTDVERQRNIFHIMRDTDDEFPEGLTTLTHGQKNVGIKFKGNRLLYIENANKKQYIRYGLNQNSGANMREIILVDKNGDVDESTPIMWDYDTITNVIAYDVDDKPITVLGGTFITIANRAERRYTYYQRGIKVNRSNVTLKGIRHEVTEEGPDGAPYSAFFDTSYANNITLCDIVVTGHFRYRLITDERNSMGTYEIGGSFANNVTWRNVTQIRDIQDTNYWGVIGTNYCKNMNYENCVLSRFDAHQGVYNVNIRNSEIGWQNLSVIGAGTLRVENTRFHNATVVALRGDYGSTWQGDVYFKNIEIDNKDDVTLIGGGWTNHNFGYTCYMPENIYIDGVTLKDNSKKVNILGNFAQVGLPIDKKNLNGVENLNPHVLPKRVVIVSNDNNNIFNLSNNTIFENVKIENLTKK